MTCESGATSTGFTVTVLLERLEVKLCYRIWSLKIIAILSHYILLCIRGAKGDRSSYRDTAEVAPNDL